ncbi:chemotaxis response regulator protein-glutamate methylesterase [candidate division KSB3 bacterium]|uniref:Protein-glutamate methylesterase/protein-glutamine glutaminase n=1 Tax=candidate division KSB3 bacterium TaxID=2044937 RepID=A0A2G6EA32_9BACT|nr:MAG: chemotaxis response regulator protein-glutamate methylesterase [candidate division KSB3 bacterium]
MIRVLVVDDSAVMLRLLSEIINDDPGLQVIATASHGYEAIRKAETLRPDVITMDVNMPHMDGLKAVEHIMISAPTPIVMISSLTRKGAEITLKALDLGAIDFVSKPSGYVSLDIGDIAHEILSKIKLAAKIRVVGTVKNSTITTNSPSLLRRATLPEPPKRGEDIDIEHAIFRYVLSRSSGNIYNYSRVVAIGCSTGGPQALNDILLRFPQQFPAPILIAQHMPEKFTEKMAELLDRRAELHVVEAKRGMKLQKGLVYIAPGAYNLKVLPDRTLALIEDNTPSSQPRPSVDMLFISVAAVFREQAVGVLLTGMGGDGVIGMNAIKDAKGVTIAQDEESSLVFGMPKMAIESGCVDSIVPLALMADEIMDSVNMPAKR